MGKRDVWILYGSETGNSQDFAYMLAYKLKYLRFTTHVLALDELDLKKLLDIKNLIIICSTTGQGELPRNSLKFWKFMLKKKLPHDLLSHVKFTTFGLGDSSYPKFNFAIKKIHARLLQLGAKEASPRAESDEQSPDGSESFYSAWESELLKNLGTLYPLPPELPVIQSTQLLLPSIKLQVQKNKFKINTEANIKELSITKEDHDNVTLVQVAENTRLTALDHFQDVRKLVLKDSKGGLNYKPGDSISIYPYNDPKQVDLLIKSQGWESIADYPIEILTKEALPRIENGGLIKKKTLRSLLTHHLDIASIPKRTFFMLVWHFASDEREKEKLQEFSKVEETQALYDYCNRPRRSIVEVIQEFFSLKIPVEYLFDVFPLIKPRLFSISSKPSANEVELTIAIVEYQTIIRKLRQGLCTKYIKDLQPGDKLLISVIKNNLKINLTPQTPQPPLIMIGPGTGIAPIKSIIEQVVSTDSDRKLYLFPGNRDLTKSYLYGELWLSLAQQGRLHLFPSFSREQGWSGGRYVQDTMYLNKQLINDLIMHEDAIIYLCGSSGKMPNQVRITIETILSECNDGWNEERAKTYLLNELENKFRYVQETW